MATAHMNVDITLTVARDTIATATVKVPLTLDAGPINDGHVTLTPDTAGLTARLTAALQAFEDIAEG